MALFALKWLFLAILAEKDLGLALVVEYWPKEMNRLTASKKLLSKTHTMRY
jgi:hypothetical protein